MGDVRIAIVGAGALSSRRIYPYIGVAGAELVGVCDLDEEKRERNARRFGGRAYQDLDLMLEEEDPDGVIICIGPEMHAELAPRIMGRGLPVYTEKPPAVDATSALQVARASKETGVLCTTAFKKRYTDAANRAKEWLAQFDPDDFYSISIDYCSSQYSHEAPRSTFLLDFAIHVIDLVPYLFGDPSQVFAFSKGKDAYAVSVKFANGAVGSLNLSCGRSFRVPTEEIEISIRGGNSMTIHNSSCWKITEGEKPCEWREPSTFTSAGDSGNDTGHLAEIADFVKAIEEGRTTRSNIFESYKTMVFYEAIQKSSETSEIVEIRYEEV